MGQSLYTFVFLSIITGTHWLCPSVIVWRHSSPASSSLASSALWRTKWMSTSIKSPPEVSVSVAPTWRHVTFLVRQAVFFLRCVINIYDSWFVGRCWFSVHHLPGSRVASSGVAAVGDHVLHDAHHARHGHAVLGGLHRAHDAAGRLPGVSASRPPTHAADGAALHHRLYDGSHLLHTGKYIVICCTRVSKYCHLLHDGKYVSSAAWE